jgi:hypothetical protein
VGFLAGFLDIITAGFLDIIAAGFLDSCSGARVARVASRRC